MHDPALPKMDYDVASFDIIDTLSAMKIQESTTYKRRPEDRVSLACPNSAAWRELIVSWFYIVADAFQMCHNVVTAATYYLDVALEEGLVASRLEYQLVSLTAFQLAIKLYELKVFPLTDLIKLSKDSDFKESDIMDKERELISVLNWYLHPPTSNCFLEIYIMLLPSEDQVPAEVQSTIRAASEKLLQIATCRSEFFNFPPSILAYAAVLNVLDRLNFDVPLCQVQAFVLSVQHSLKLTSNPPELLNAFELLEQFLNNDGSIKSEQEVIIASQETCPRPSPSKTDSNKSLISNETSPRQGSCFFEIRDER
jgi:hypothetical protein